MSGNCPVYEWCINESPEHEAEGYHEAELEPAVHGDNVVPISISRYELPGEDDWGMTINLDWEIDSRRPATFGDTIDTEFAALRSIVGQIESRVREFHRLHVGEPIRRPGHVDEALRRLADS